MSSNLVRGFEEDDEEHFQSSTILTYSSIDSHCNNINNNPTPDDRSSSHVVSKKKRNLPGNPDPEAEVVALSPRTLMATNRYICEVCHKGFQRDQNLQLHRRGHNLPWKLKQRAQTASSQANKKRVYVCPEPSCVHHDPRRALGDLTGIKKHYCRKHGEKKWKCDKCSKRYAVQSDWKAHAKICGSREYRCDCGTVFSRKDSFVTHRAFCDAITDENYRKNHNITAASSEPIHIITNQAHASFSSRLAGPDADPNPNPQGLAGLSSHDQQHHSFKQFMSLNSHGILIPNSTTVDLQNHHPYYNNARNSMTTSSSNLGFNGFSHASSSATALLQKAAEMGSKVSDSITPIILRGFAGYNNNNNNNNNTNSNNNINNGNKASDLVDNLRDGGGGGLSASGFNGLVMSDDDGCGSNNFGFFMGSDRISNNPRTGLYDLHGTSRKGLFVGENEKMTVDFLGMDSNAGNYHSDEWNSWRRD